MRPNPTMTPVPARPVRGRVRWYALGLIVLAPFIAETVASANTPAFIFPILLPFYAVVYGCPALLVRELSIRGRIRVPHLVLLGIAYTAFNEGVVAATWFKLVGDDHKILGFTATQAGHVGGVNWAVAVNLIVFHTVYSLAVPIILMQGVAIAHRSDAAYRPWLGRTGIIVCLALITFVLLGSLTTKATDKTCKGVAHDGCATGRDISAVLIVALVVLVVALPPLRRAVAAPVRAPRRDRWLIALGAGFGVAFFASYFALPLAGLPAASVATGVVLLAVVALAARHWTAVLRWPQLRTGVVLCCGLLAPGILVSLRAVLVGQPVLAALAVWLLVWLLKRLPRPAAR